MPSRPAPHRLLLISLLVLPLLLIPGHTARLDATRMALAASRAMLLAATASPASSPATSAPTTAAATSAPVPTEVTVPTTTTPGSDTGGAGTSSDIFGTDSGLLEDELLLLNDTVPDLSTGVPLSSLPPITGSVSDLETRIVGLLSRIQSSSLSSSAKNALINRLLGLNTTLDPALGLLDQIASLRLEANTLLQARVDTQAGIDKVAASVQVNLDKLRVSVESTVSANVVASVGSLSVTVTGGADTIEARLGAQVNRLLVNVITDLDVLHIATLNAVANVDTSRLNVNLYALVKKLRLDLNLLLTALSVNVHADISAAITAEAALTASLALEIDGLRAGLAANVDAKLSIITGQLGSLINAYNGDLTSATSTLQGIESGLQ